MTPDLAEIAVRIAVLETRLAETVLRIEDARREYDRRLEQANGLHDEMSAYRALFVTRDAFDTMSGRLSETVLRAYYEEQHRSLADRVSKLDTQVAQARSRSAAYSAGIGLAFTVLVAVIILANWSH